MVAHWTMAVPGRLDACLPPLVPLHFLADAPTYACFCRSWWDGSGMDAVAWWGSGDTHRRWVVNSGERTEPGAVLTGTHHWAAKAEIEQVVAQFQGLGLCALRSQERKIIYTHFDDWFGLKAPGMAQPHWIQVCGGQHADRRCDALLDAVLARCPELSFGA